MTDWRDKLIEKMARAAWNSDGNDIDWKILDSYTQSTYLHECRAALEVAEPVIRERCAEAAAAIANEHLTDTVARLVAAAIREGGKDD